MKTTFKWSTTTLLLMGGLSLSGCGGGYNTAANDCSGAVDGFICQVMKVVNSDSDTADPISTDSITATSPETADPVPI